MGPVRGSKRSKGGDLYINDLVLQEWILDTPGRDHERECEYEYFFLSRQVKAGWPMPGGLELSPVVSKTKTYRAAKKK
jgi:hypothetical protein